MQNNTVFVYYLINILELYFSIFIFFNIYIFKIITAELMIG